MTMPLSDVTLIRLINPLIKSIMLSCKVEYNNIVISHMRDDLICQAPWLFQPPFLLVHGYFAMLPYYSVLPYYLILQEMPGSLFIPTSPSIRETRVGPPLQVTSHSCCRDRPPNIAAHCRTRSNNDEQWRTKLNFDQNKSICSIQCPNAYLSAISLHVHDIYHAFLIW